MPPPVEDCKKVLVDLYVERTVQYRREFSRHGRYLRRVEWRFIAAAVADQFAAFCKDMDGIDVEAIARTLIDCDRQYRSQNRKVGVYLPYGDVRQVAIFAAERLFPQKTENFVV